MSKPRLDAPLWYRTLRDAPPHFAQELATNVIVHTLSERVLDLVLRLNKDVGLDAQKLLEKRLAPLPADNCWIEYPSAHSMVGRPTAIVVRELAGFRGMDMGLLVGDETHIVQVVYRDVDDRGGDGVVMGLLFPLVDGRPVPTERLVAAHMNKGSHPLIPFHSQYLAAVTEWAKVLIATCALLAVRGATTVECEKRRDKRLSRRTGEASPKFEYRVVDVNIDIMGGGDDGNGGGDGVGRALHHVRGHLRLTEKSGLVSVRPHWRGNAALGLIRRDMNIKRDEEMAH